MDSASIATKSSPQHSTFTKSFPSSP
uniref:Uncharacterized protein n=1 Tax=Rhizophora mucronata TaxID=61149 RepID=A0A2P2NE92_RHIMU